MEMAETTDMSDNASASAILAEQTAVVGLLNDNASFPTSSIYFAHLNTNGNISNKQTTQPPTAISMDAQQPDSLMTDAVDAATEQTIVSQR